MPNRDSYKSETRRLRRGQEKILRHKLASSFSKKKISSFWSAVKRCKTVRSRSHAQMIDGLSGERCIANYMASKLEKVLNTHSAASRENIAVCLSSSLSTDQLAGVVVTEDEVMDAISSLKPLKSDASGISSELLQSVTPVVSECLAALFTAILRHGYMPKCLRLCYHLI